MDQVVLGQFLTRYHSNGSNKVRVSSENRFSRPAGFTSRRLMWAAGFTLLLLVILSAFILTIPSKTEATLVVDQGQATVRMAATTFQTSPKDVTVSAGQMLVVKTGDQISLAGDAFAYLRYYDGSSTELMEGAQVYVEELDTTQDTYRVRLQQAGGKTVNRVIRLLGLNDRFEIITPSSTVSVRGTVFTVAVISQDSTFVAVEKGVVHFEMGDSSADIRAGEELLGVVGQPLQVVPSIPAVPPGTPASVLGVPPANPPPGANPPVVVPPPPAAPNGSPQDVLLPPVGGDDAGVLEEDLPPGVKSPNVPNTPPQVPGNTPNDLPGQGNPPTGGGTPPGQGGDPPGQDKPTKDKPDKPPKPEKPEK
jgi:hypothetical protein